MLGVALETGSLVSFAFIFALGVVKLCRQVISTYKRLWGFFTESWKGKGLEHAGVPALDLGRGIISPFQCQAVLDVLAAELQSGSLAAEIDVQRWVQTCWED